MIFDLRLGDICKLLFYFTDLRSTKARLVLALNELDQCGDIKFIFITIAARAWRQYFVQSQGNQKCTT